MGRSNRYAPEVRDRAVRLVSAQRNEYDSEWAAICSIAASSGVRRRRCVYGCASRSGIRVYAWVEFGAAGGTH